MGSEKGDEEPVGWGRLVRRGGVGGIGLMGCRGRMVQGIG